MIETIEDTGIYQQIYESLLIGDYMEVKGVCMGKSVLVELLTEPAAPKVNSIVPLRIHMTENGPVTVSSISPSKHEKQEKMVKVPIRENANFNLCILALENAFKITLNKELVCTHEYIVDLEAIQAVGVDGDALFTDIEFKDSYSEGDFETAESETPAGFIRMQELRESSMRKKGQPVYISTGSPSQYTSPLAPPPTTSLPANSRQNLHQPTTPSFTMTPKTDSLAMHPQSVATPDTDYVITRVSKSGKDIAFFPGLRDVDQSRHVYGAPPNANSVLSRSDPIMHRSPDDDYIMTRMSETGKGPAFFPGRVESSTLDRPSEFTGTPGIYRPYNDEEVTRRYQKDHRSSLTPSITDKKSKRRSWFGSKNRKSQSPESHFQSTESISKEGKPKKGGLFGRGKKGTTPPSQSAESLNTLNRDSMNTDVTLRRTQGADTGRPVYMGVATERDRIKGTLPKSVAGGTAPEMAGYVAGQRALPEFDNFSLIPNDQDSRSENRTSRVSRPVSSQYVNQILESPRVIRTSYVPRDSYRPRESYTPRESVPLPNRQISVESKYRTSYYPEPVRYSPQIISNNERIKTMPQTVSTYNQAEYYVKDPPKTAAIIYEKQVDRNLAISDGSLVDIGRYKPPEVVEPLYQRPKMDIDYRPRSPEPVKSQKIYSMPDISVIEPVPLSAVAYNSQRRNSAASIDGLEKGFYLVVGNTTYYQERSQSLKRHRSSRSLRRETGAYRSTSHASSISSFRLNEMGGMVANQPVKSGHTSRDINTWLRTQSQEDDIQPTSATYRMQYAAPPASQSLVDESRDAVPLPVNLKFPENESTRNNHELKMKTCFTADSKVAGLTLNLANGEQRQIVFDFVDDCVYLLQEGDQCEDKVVVAKEIPFVAEQIREIRVSSCRKEDQLKLYVNRVELCSLAMTGKWPCTVDVTGDFTLNRVWRE